MKFLHCADLHLGSKQFPQLYKEKMLELLLESYYLHKCDFLLCAGDIFDVGNPNQVFKDELLDTILFYSDANFVFSVGNHDYIDKAKSYHSLKYLKSLEPYLNNITVIEDGEYINKFGLNFYSIQETDLNTHCNKNNQPADILVWHGVIPNIDFATGTISNTDTLRRLLNEYNAKYFALGDIHQPIELIKNKCYYPGSLVQKTFGCVPGINIVDLDSGEVTKTCIDLPRKITVTIQQEKTLTEQDILTVVKSTVDTNYCYLKIKVCLPFIHWYAINKKELVDNLKKLFLDVTLDYINTDTAKKVDEKVMFEGQTIETELETVVNNYNAYSSKKPLVRYCLRVTNDVGTKKVDS